MTDLRYHFCMNAKQNLILCTIREGKKDYKILVERMETERNWRIISLNSLQCHSLKRK